MLTPFATRQHTFSYLAQSLELGIERKMLVVWPCCPEQCFQLSSPNTAQTIGKLFAQ